MANLQITLVHGLVHTTARQRDNVRSLGLRKIGQSVVREDNAVTRGMVNAVRHLVSVEEVD